MKSSSSAPLSSSSSSQQMVSSYLPDECWESIFRFIIIDDDCNNNNNNNNKNYNGIGYFGSHKSFVTKNFVNLNSLSLVSKQFLAVTNRLRFSLTFYNESTSCHIFKRFTNLNSLNIKNLYINLNNLLCKISCFPLKQLTSLNISNQHTIPANGLRTFSQKITTLTSLTCSHVDSINNSDLFLIAECFPLLEQLDLSYPLCCKLSSSYVDGVKALSLRLTKLREVNLSGFPINYQSLFHLFNNCRKLEEVIIFNCVEITSKGLASALRERPTLRSLSFSTTSINPELFSTSHFIDSLATLKGITCLVLRGFKISDELLYSIARECLPLTRFVLRRCTGHSYDGIKFLLSKCQHIQQLDLQYTDFLNDQHVVQLSSSFLVDLVSINLSRCRLLTDSALFALVRNCSSLSEIKMVHIQSKSGESSESLVKFGVYPELKSLYLGECPWLSDESIIMFASIFPNLQLLDLNNCNGISEGICQVLRKCCKLRYLNLSFCSGMKLLGLNFVVPELEVLNLSHTKVDDETLYVISKNCSGLLKLLLDYCCGVTEKGVKHVLDNCTQLRDHGYLCHCILNV
ncbi:EIN3-binding F-box protein 2-like [Trifolium pratense]|uniref:EIN3-binding F-box protein 2-like n=1 Tax=Trifolium pratense TaxID=57577 RepID=UPI001E694DBE|nr:EIN3-binding F-box protein 2-like [Trifolium pratense]